MNKMQAGEKASIWNAEDGEVGRRFLYKSMAYPDGVDAVVTGDAVVRPSELRGEWAALACCKLGGQVEIEIDVFDIVRLSKADSGIQSPDTGGYVALRGWDRGWEISEEAQKAGDGAGPEFNYPNFVQGQVRPNHAPFTGTIDFECESPSLPPLRSVELTERERKMFAGIGEIPSGLNGTYQNVVLEVENGPSEEILGFDTEGTLTARQLRHLVENVAQGPAGKGICDILESRQAELADQSLRGHELRSKIRQLELEHEIAQQEVHSGPRWKPAPLTPRSRKKLSEECQETGGFPVVVGCWLDDENPIATSIVVFLSLKDQDQILRIFSDGSWAVEPATALEPHAHPHAHLWSANGELHNFGTSELCVYDEDGLAGTYQPCSISKLIGFGEEEFELPKELMDSDEFAGLWLLRVQRLQVRRRALNRQFDRLVEELLVAHEDGGVEMATEMLRGIMGVSE